MYANNRQLHPTEEELIKRNAERFAKQLYGTDNPTPDEIKGALALLANTAQSILDYNLGYTVPSSSLALEFLQTLQAEYIAMGSGTLVQGKYGTLEIPGSGGQQLFNATDTEKNQPWLNAGLTDKEFAGIIVKTPFKTAENPPSNTGPRDPATNLPLDKEGRYSQRYVVDGKGYEAKFFPCPTASAGCGGQNRDMADPGTQAYVKALGKKIFDDIGTGATIATIANPVGVLGTVAAYVGILASVTSGVVDGAPKTAIAKEALTAAATKYLQGVYGLSEAVATRVTELIDLSGGWQAIIDRSKDQVTGSSREYK